MSKMSAKDKQDLKPLYLKRRLQLLQAGPASSSSSEIDHLTEEQEEAERIKQYFNKGEKYQPVMRNKRYISLRVKLLKRQFGLPSEVLSLRSLNLSQMPNDTENSSTSGSFNRVHHIFDSLHKAQITRMEITVRSSGNNNGALHLVSSSLDGIVAVTSLEDFESKILQHSDGVIDFDVSASPHDLLASACTDGSVVLWHIMTGSELRRLHQDSSPFTRSNRITGVRFMPNNNNLVVCATSSGLLRVLNVSTGKFSGEGCGHTTGKTNCMVVRDSLLWVGSDRGYVESFRLDDSGGKVLKGCRVAVQQQVQQPITCLSASVDGKMLVATAVGSQNLFLFKIVDEFGTVTPFRAFNAGPESGSIRSTVLFESLAACGSDDGSILFFDMEKNAKPCVDKLSGHSKPVVNAEFSNDGSFLVSADLSGQIIVWKKS